MRGKEPLYINKMKENKRPKCIQDLEAHNTDVVSIATNILESREKQGEDFKRQHHTQIKSRYCPPTDNLRFALMKLHSL